MALERRKSAIWIRTNPDPLPASAGALYADSMTPALNLLITEAELQRAALEALHLHGYKTFVDRQAFRSDPGWPDIYALHPDRGALAVEVKRERGTVSAAQQGWLDAHRAAGHAAIVLRPSTWPDFVALLQGPPA